MTQTVNIEIMGQQLSLLAPAEEAVLLRQAVVLLNRKIDAVCAQQHLIESDKIVMVAALNLAHDFLRENRTDGLDLEAAGHKIDDMLRLCREAGSN